MVGRLLLVLVLLGAWVGASHAQTTTTDRLAALERVVVGSGTFGTTSPWQVVGLPTKTSQTDCAWLDASGNVFRGACPTGDLTGLTFTAPGIFSVSGSPCTSGDCTIGLTLANQNANLVFAGPSSGGAAAPTFRALVDNDVPNDLTLGTVSGTPTFSGATTFSAAGTALSVTNNAAFGGIASSLIPSLTDTFNLGSSLRLWNEGFVSQLNAVIYAEQTATLFGGWSVIGKNAGTFAAAVGAADTSINFGKAMTNGHFIVVRAHDTGGTVRAEHMQITGTTGCTTCTVTRGLNTGGTGYAFAQGTSYLVSGTTGDGRIELRAYSTPQISVVEQGATYNAQTERVRIGYLDGAAGMGATTGKVGIVIGDASQYLRYYDGVLTIAGNGSGITSINGGNITTGTISADRIAAGSITASKLLLRAGGAALTDDPDHVDSAAWVTAGGSCALGFTSSGQVGTGVIGNAATNTECWMRSARPVAVDATKTYRVRGWMRNAGGGTATVYLAVLLFDSAGANINGDGTWWYYAATTNPSAAWTLYEGKFGAGTAKTIPSNARTMAVGVILNYSTPAAWHQAQDVRIEEAIPASLIVDGAITADKLSATAIDGKTITGSTMRHANLDADSYHRRWQLDGDGLAFGVGSGAGDLGNTLRFLSSGTRVSQFGYWNSTAHWWGGAASTILIGAQDESTHGANEDPVIKLRSNSNVSTPRYAWLDVDGPNGRVNIHGVNQGVFIAQDSTQVSRVHTDTDLVVEQNIEGKGLYITNWSSGGSDHLCRNASATAAWITVCSSSARYKQDIVPAREDWARILDVTPMQYHWRTQPTAPLELGAIAEDVDALGLPALVRYDERGRPDGLRYERMALYLIPLVKEQRERIASLEQRLAALEVQVAAQQPKSGPDAFYPVYRGGPLPEGALTRTCSCTLGIPPVCACDPAPVPILMKGHP